MKGEFEKLKKIILLKIAVPVIVFVVLMMWLGPLLRGPARMPSTPTPLSPSPPGNYELVVNCTIPKNLPTKMPLLKIIPEPIPLEKWLQVAREIFNMTGKLEINKDYDSNETFIKEVAPHGGFSSFLQVGYGGYFTWTLDGSPLTYLVPSFDEARRIADGMLEKLREHGVVPENIQVEYSSTKYSWWRNGRPIGVTVFYTLKFRGYPFCQKFSVELTGEGVDTVFGAWRFFEVADTVQLITVEEAMSRLSPPGISGGAVTDIIINSVELGYTHNRQVQEYIPTYIFKAALVITTLTGELETMETVLTVPAVP